MPLIALWLTLAPPALATPGFYAPQDVAAASQQFAQAQATAGATFSSLQARADALAAALVQYETALDLLGDAAPEAQRTRQRELRQRYQREQAVVGAFANEQADAFGDVPGTPAKMATVKGDAAKGPHASFVKLPAGFSAPLHSHSADHHVAVVAGTLTETPEGGAAKKLGPGSWFEFTGKKKHVTTCDAGADCVLFIVAKGAWDLVPADPAK